MVVVDALTFMTVVVGDDRLPRPGLLHAPASGVDAPVVEPAEQDQVLSGRHTAISPMLDVVRFDPSDRAVAALPSTPFRLLKLQLPPKGSVREAHRPT
ncbi:hypothetical protein O2L01_19955, partial [Glycomyces lechevalierae]